MHADPGARFLTAEIDGTWIASVYVPNGQVVGSETQTRAMDRYLRLCFGVPATLAPVVKQADLPSLGVNIQTHLLLACV